MNEFKITQIQNLKSLFWLLLMFNFSLVNCQILNLEALVSKNDKCVLKIFTVDEYGELKGQGSGVLIDSKGIAITNFHVLDGAFNAVAVTLDGEKYKIDKILDYSMQNDLVKFKLENLSAKLFPKVTLNSAKLLKGSSVFSIGYPNGFVLLGESTVSQGIVSGFRKEEVRPGHGEVDSLIQTTTQITHGNSGGGLFDSKGNLIGITQGTFAEMEDRHANLNKAIPVKYIKLLKRNLNYNFEEFITECAKTNLFAQGVLAYNNGDYVTSYDLLQAYQKVNELNKLDPRVWYLKGNCAFHLGRKSNRSEILQMALENYSEALILDSMSVNTRSYMALTFEQLGKMDYAFEVAKDGYNINPKNAFCNYVLGKLYNVSEKRDLAINYLTVAISLYEDKNYDYESLAKWYLERAVAYEMKEDLINSEADYLKCLKINKADIDAWYHYGCFLHWCKRYNDACSVFQIIKSMNENYTDYAGSIKELIKISCY
jgi:tetratricopeptide (TPR) repeat protein